MRKYLNQNTELVTRFFRANWRKHDGINTKGVTSFDLGGCQPGYVFNFDRLVPRSKYLTGGVRKYPELQLGWKITYGDLSTTHGYKWTVGKWNVPEQGLEAHLLDMDMTTAKECPTFKGDGLCLAKTWSGAQSGGIYRGASGTMLLFVAYKQSDVLHDSHRDKFRVRKCFVIASDTIANYDAWLREKTSGLDKPVSLCYDAMTHSGM